MVGFVFYDTETTGTETSFDQILQFAAIHTDANFNELERFEIRCQLLPGIVAAPGAMKVTGVRASQLNNPDLPSHYQMMRQIREKFLKWSPSVFLGYNSIQFDEHLIRHSFYKTLFPPYLTNTSGNSRSDVLRMIQATSIFNPNTLIIPLGDNGKPSYKLDKVAPANGFNHSNAHDALADVEATIYLCQIISERAPDVWSSFMRFSQKAAVRDHVSSELVFNYSDFYFMKPYSYLTSFLGENPDNNSEVFIFDLEVDPASLIELSDEQLIKRLNQQPKPVRRLHANACPIIMSVDETPEFVAAKTLGIDEIERRALFIAQHDNVRKRLISIFRSIQKVSLPSPYVEKQLYDGFFSYDDQARMEIFHQIPWIERVAIVAQFEDIRLKDLALRLIDTESPASLSDSIRNKIKVAHAERLLSEDDDLPWLTLKKARQELQALINNSIGEEREFYCEHLAFVTEKISLAEANI